MILGMSYYNICLYFLVYSFGGWVLEVAYHAVVTGKVINRGFLNGPVCPVYGFGALGIFALMHVMQPENTIEMNSLLVFVIGTVIATIVELTAGWLLETLFHARWWDYSNKPFNFHGYICLEFSLLWGVAILIVVKVIHPLVRNASGSLIPVNYAWWIMLVLYIMYLADLIVSVLTVIGFNKRLKELDLIREKMRLVSDGMSREIAVNTIRTTQKVQEGKVQAALAKADMQESAAEQKEAFQKRADQLYAEIYRKHGRLMNAFPDIRHRDYAKTLEDVLNGWRGRHGKSADNDQLKNQE